MKVYLVKTLQQLTRQSGVPFVPRFLAFPDSDVLRQDNGDGTFNFQVTNIDAKYGAASRETFKCTILSTINNVLDTSTTELTVLNSIKIAPSNQPVSTPLPVIVGSDAVISMEGNETSETNGQTTVYVKTTIDFGEIEIICLLFNTPINTPIATLFPSISTVLGLTTNRVAAAINSTATATAATAVPAAIAAAAAVTATTAEDESASELPPAAHALGHPAKRGVSCRNASRWNTRASSPSREVSCT